MRKVTGESGRLLSPCVKVEPDEKYTPLKERGLESVYSQTLCADFYDVLAQDRVITAGSPRAGEAVL